MVRPYHVASILVRAGDKADTTPCEFRPVNRIDYCHLGSGQQRAARIA